MEHKEHEEPKSSPRPSPVRVTADLPQADFDKLDTARILNGASTTDITRALLRLQDSDAELAARVTLEIAKMRAERAQQRLREKQERGEPRQRGKKAAPKQEELSAA